MVLKGRLIAVFVWFSFGALLWWLLPAQPPTLAELQTVTGRITSVKEYTRPARYGSNYDLFIHIQGYPDPFLLSPGNWGFFADPGYHQVKHKFQVGDSVTIWTTGTWSSGGCVDVWQVSRADEILVPYADMLKGSRHEHMIMLGLIWLMPGMVLILIRSWIEPKRPVRYPIRYL